MYDQADERPGGMYHKYFGLEEAPFSIAVNPRYLYMSERHRDALAHLLYGVGVGGGFILLTGEVGTGKTTITRCLLEQLPPKTDVALILNPALDAVQLLAAVCDELHLDYQSDESNLKELTDKLQRFLLANHQRGRNTVLLIDEAQHLQFEALEQIRLLTNLETNTRKLLQIILVGQPELKVMLARPELRQLSQRVTARYQLKPFSLEETGSYIRHRLQVAGLHANQELFPPRVVQHIHHASQGIPRLVNVLCDRILLGTYGQNKARVDMAMARQATLEVKGEDDELISHGARWVWPATAAALALTAIGAVLWWQAQVADLASLAGGAEALPREATPPPLTSPPEPASAPPDAMPDLPAVVIADNPVSLSLPDTAEAGLPLWRSPLAAASSPDPQADPGSAAVVEAAVDKAPEAAADEAVAEFEASLQPLLEPEPGSSLESVAEQEPEPGSSLESVAEPELEAVLFDQETAVLNRLLILQGTIDTPLNDPCEDLAPKRWRCNALTAESWPQLLTYNAPVAIEIFTEEGNKAWLALVAVDDDVARLAGEQEDYSLSLEALGALWTGRFILPWQVPPGYVGPIRPGDEGRAVAWLSQQFALLDKQPKGLAENRYNELLQQRVALFQSDQSLLVDGVAGINTILRIRQLLEPSPLLQVDTTATQGAQ